MLCSWRTSYKALLTTAAFTVCYCDKPISVTITSTPRERLTPVNCAVVVERCLELVAGTDVRIQLTQVYHPQSTPALSLVFFETLVLVEFFFSELYSPSITQ